MLDALGDTVLPPAIPSVPEWAWGTVHRRSITFATGVEDDRTFVAWVQAHAMTGDIRIHPARPHLKASDRLSGLDHATLSLLASAEGGVAETRWAEGVMSWHGWIGFQTYDKYPEPGLMTRIGTAMIECAPSGIYVEDWRFQPSRKGALAALRLAGEILTDGSERKRDGGLVVAGDHAILTLCRLRPLPEGVRAQDFVRDSDDPVSAAEQVLDCTVDYAEIEDGSFRIRASTDPRREATRPFLSSRFERQDQDGRTVIEHITDSREIRARIWRIESFEPGCQFPLATPAPARSLAWLAAESDTLIAPLGQPGRSPACGS